MTDTQPEALRLAQELDAVPETGADPQTIQEAAAELRRLHAYCQELESHLILDCMTHVQKPAEIEHVAGVVSKNGAELNMTCASHGQAPAQAAPVCGSPADLPPLPDPDLRDVGTTPGGIKEFLRGYATEYAKAALASSAPADSVLEDAARLDWLLLHISGAEFRRIGVHYSGNARRADVDTARKQGANHD